jgi:Asp-tRNA(Asn)/Glu-tRNA(Gln) amidotransferase A subunit family amidase
MRKVSPLELTKMYLAAAENVTARKLNCVVTLTEDLALAQARRC